MMKREYKKIIAVFLPIPLFLAITFCCCLDEKAFADEVHSNCSSENPQESHELEKSDHSEHQEHSEGDHSCSCPKHLSFLSAQSADIIFVSTSQMLAKNFMANVHFESVSLLASLSSQTHGPPFQDHLDHVSLPIYLKNSNLRL
ncbi:MAG: hypothetical protein KBD53_11285 [Candidatus Omnitrophica bacterium]|nr:hypothetical protein [Candidatus Omnitrophota bacterium]